MCADFLIALLASTNWIEYNGIANHKKLLESNANSEEFEVDNPADPVVDGYFGFSVSLSGNRAWPLRIRCSLVRFFRTNKMPDVDSYDSSSGIAVDVQQRLNCALP
jgi:hypothetical protein